MQPNLSLILPAYNVERTLADQVHRLLEVVGELTTKFEILVVDDGSLDHTCDVADELAREFPQLRVIRHGQRRGTEGTAETGLAKAKGDVLMMLTPGEPIQLAELKRLWQASQTSGVDTLRTPPAMRPLSKALLGRLSQWGQAVSKKSESTKSVQLLHRDSPAAAVNEMSRPSNFMAHLRNLAIGE